MEYAKRIDRIPPYLFAEIDRVIGEKKTKGIDIINLGVGDPDLPTPGNIVEALRRTSLDPKNHRYPSYAGMLEFRRAVSNWYKRRFNVSLNPGDEILALIGSKEGIAHTPLAFINPGDIALIPDPAYPVYRIGTLLADGIPVSMPLLKENGFKPELSEIKKETAEKAKLMFLNYPNAPTTATAGREFFKEVVDFAVEHDIIVLHDNPYSEMTFDNYKAISFLEIRNAKEVGVEFHSLSKTYNMTGWRMGMVAGNRDVIAGIGKVKENVDSGVFQGIQYAGIEALRGPQEPVKRNMRILEERRNIMVDGLRDMRWEVDKPKATFYLWFELPQGYESSMEFCRDL
ncbi:MAG: LL-diaminopimelate aminotransferase, partial [Candidatus Altiarchaeales archaeon]|nr:LL-diaminopimelate aminotransferase [Candidatus Altiarchaeales archaeon]